MTPENVITAEFGYSGRSTSPARRRMEEAGRKFAEANGLIPPKPSIIKQLREQEERERVRREEARALRLADEKARRMVASDRMGEAWIIARRMARGFAAPTKSIKQIVSEVAARHRVSVTDINSNRRQPHIVLARFEAYYRCATETNHSLAGIGRIMGRDHTSVRYGVAKYRELLAREAGE